MMNQPTIEEIRKIIENCSEELAAERIYELFAPTYKPLSELHKDQEACMKIYRLAANSKMKSVDRRTYGTWLLGDGLDILIQDHGWIITLDSNANLFLIVDFIRSLGYSAS